MNITSGKYTTVPAMNGTEFDSMGIELRVSLSLIMACVCTGSVFGKYYTLIMYNVYVVHLYIINNYVHICCDGVCFGYSKKGKRM